MAPRSGTGAGSGHVLDRLAEYFCGGLSDADELAVEAHLLHCGACRAEYDDLGSAALLIAAMPVGPGGEASGWPVEDAPSEPGTDPGDPLRDPGTPS